MKTQIPQKAANRSTPEGALKVQLTQNYGYRIDGDSVQVNAVLALPASLLDAAYSLELWASETPCQATDPKAQADAHCVTTVSLELPTPLVAIEHAVQVSGAARFPLQGEGRSMVLALVHTSVSGVRSVADLGKFSSTESFPSLRVASDAQYRVQGNELVLDIPRIDNDRAFGNQSGSLLIELRALATKPGANVASGTEAVEAGHLLATLPLSQISGGYFLPNVSEHLALSAPAVGSYRVALLLKEWTQAFGFTTRDVKLFATPYEVAAPAKPAASAPSVVAANVAAPVKQAAPLPSVAVAAPSVAVAAPSAPAPAKEAVAAVSAAAPSVAAQTKEAVVANVAVPAKQETAMPSVGAATAAAAAKQTVAEAAAEAKAAQLLSLQSASVEQLAQLEGLNERLAKEIVKARPITSFNDLLKLRGIGERMLQKLKSQITL
jgi:DNA uptake protein ComE-like DNA-binding protein